MLNLFKFLYEKKSKLIKRFTDFEYYFLCINFREHQYRNNFQLNYRVVPVVVTKSNAIQL